MRIASLLPSATEMVHFAGAADSLVGVTHECDFPSHVANLPRLTSSKIDQREMTSRERDAAVNEAVSELSTVSDERSIYALDAALMRELAPELVVTQGLCEVCAVSESVVESVVSKLPEKPEVLSLNPTSLDDVFSDAARIGEAVGRGARVREKVAGLKERLEVVRENVPEGRTPRVGCIEWLDPPFSAGHWVPEMVRFAGGEDVFSGPGEVSRRMDVGELLDADPEVIVLMPCGFDVERAMEEVPAVLRSEGWCDLSAVKSGDVWVVDANSHFSRPGPRLVDGVEILAKILHPEAFDPLTDGQAIRLAAARLSP